MSKKSILTQGTLRITQRALRINIENQFLAPFAKTFCALCVKEKMTFGAASSKKNRNFKSFAIIAYPELRLLNSLIYSNPKDLSQLPLFTLTTGSN
jgi:hypothetical protein